MRNEDLAAIVGDLNHVPETAARISRHAPLVLDTNMLIRDAADALITLDATSLSFQALKAECKPPA